MLCEKDLSGKCVVCFFGQALLEMVQKKFYQYNMKLNNQYYNTIHYKRLSSPHKHSVMNHSVRNHIDYNITNSQSHIHQHFHCHLYLFIIALINNITLMENIASHDDEFFILLERVGTKGKYQRHIFLLFFALWFITAFLILGVAFLLLPTHFTCPALPNQQQCNAFVCALPQNQWSKYQGTRIVNSLVTELGDYHCQNISSIATYKMTLFLGVFMGYIVFMHFSDNFGRRFGLILTWSTAVAGFVLISLSRNIFIASVGLLLAGAGCESNMRISIAILNQIVDYHLRQKYSLILQCSFGVAGVFVSIAYYWLRDWRQVTTFFCTLPAFILLLLIVLYLEDTPNYLYKNGSAAVLKSLSKIAQINGFECQVTEQQVVRVMELKKQHEQQQNYRRSFTIKHLFKYKSLKNNTINLACLLFLLSALYIGPNSAIDKFQIDIFVLQIILSISDIVAYPIACFFIATAKRKQIGLKCFLISGVCNLIAGLISSSPGCTTCFNDIAKLILIFCARYCVSYYYGVLFIYVIEIYPEQIRTIGFGTVSAVGSLGALAVQKVMDFTSRNGHQPLLYFSIFSFLCLFFTSKLPETQGLPLPLEIEQLKKQKIKRKYDPSDRQSYEDIQIGGHRDQQQSEGHEPNIN